MIRGRPAASRRLPKLMVAGTLALYLLLALIYNSATPIFEASDEFRHYLTIRYIAQRHELPVLQSSDDLFAPWQEAGQPPLYYLAGALLTGWIDTSDIQNTDVNTHAQAGVPTSNPDNKNLFVHSAAEEFPYHGVSLAAHLVRLVSIAMGAATVYLTYRLARTIAPTLPTVALLAAALVAFNPQFLFVSASVDNDNLITLASTAALLLMVQVLLDGLSRARLMLLSGTVGVAVLSKLSGLGLLPLATVVVGARDVKLARPRAALRHLLILAAGPVVIAGWWFVRNWLIYGEPTGLKAWADLIQARSADAAKVISELPGLFISFWGVFGAFDIQADWWVYIIYGALCLGALAGLYLGRKTIRLQLAGWGPLALLGAWFGIELVALARWTMTASASTGRLLFPGIASVAVLVALGCLAPLADRWRAIAAGAIAALLLGLAIYVPVRYIFPAFARPRIASAASALGQPSHAAQISYGGKLALLGYDISPETTTSGGDATLRLYWRVLEAMDRNYTVTVQLLTGEGLAGQDDSFPGQGRIAARRLQPGQYFSDTYTIRLRAPVAQPLIGRIKVGLYDDSLAKLTARDSSKAELPEPIVGELPIAGPHTSPSAETQLTTFGGLLALVSASPGTAVVLAGSSLDTKLRWRALGRMPQPYTVFLHLADDAGRPVAQHDAQPRDGAFPTTWWAPGESVDDSVRLTVPADVPPGRYQLLTGVYELGTLARLPVSTGGDAYRIAYVEVSGR